MAVTGRDSLPGRPQKARRPRATYLLPSGAALLLVAWVYLTVYVWSGEVIGAAAFFVGAFLIAVGTFDVLRPRRPGPTPTSRV